MVGDGAIPARARVCVCVCAYSHNRAIRPCHPRHSIVTRIDPPKGGSMIIITKTSDGTQQRGRFVCACVYVHVFHQIAHHRAIHSCPPRHQCVLYVFLHTYTLTHTHVHSHIHSHTCTLTHTHTHSHIHSHTHTYTLTHIYTHIYTHTHIHSHIHPHTYTLTHIHSHIHSWGGEGGKQKGEATQF